jgi:tetratricopeptide (TPR) repeat protein
MRIPAKEIALMMEVGQICRYARRFREAREIFQGVALLLHVRETADLAIAAVACDEHKYDEAESLCHRVLTANRRSVAAYAQLAEIQILRKDIEAAKNSLRLAHDLRPGEPLSSLVKSLLQLTKLLPQQA